MAGIIVHEWLARHGGSENVVEEIALTFPDAQIQSLWNDAPGRFPPTRVSETWLARTPLRKSKAMALPFMPLTWQHLGSSDAEWILCSSHLFAHHARFSGPARHAPKFVYAHTPARYIWSPELDARGKGAAVRVAAKPLQRIDFRRSQDATSIAANSHFVSQRIKAAWHRESEVIYPPVNVGDFAVDPAPDLTPEEEAILDSLPSDFVLGASRFIPYKRLDLVIALGVASDVHVVLAGDGPSLLELRALAEEHPGQVTFVSRPSRPLLSALYRRALAYVFPAIEDFGIMPVEAMATGAPVIARATGGAAESVIHGVTGALLEDFTGQAAREALTLAVAAKAQDSIDRAWSFDRAVFHQKLLGWVRL